MFLEELKKFSKENWWIYFLLALALSLIYLTGKGNILEILVLFFLNFLGNVFVMIMQKNYSLEKTKIGAFYHLSSTLTFSSIAIYGLIKFGQYQYIIWQICYFLATFKAIIFYIGNKNLKFLNEYFLIFLNFILIIFFIFFSKNFGINVNISSILMALGFSFATTGLISIKDNFRYFMNFIGIIFILSGSFLGVYIGFLNENIDGISLGYMILTLTTFVFYLKLLKNYLK